MRWMQLQPTVRSRCQQPPSQHGWQKLSPWPKTRHRHSNHDGQPVPPEAKLARMGTAAKKKQKVRRKVAGTTISTAFAAAHRAKSARMLFQTFRQAATAIAATRRSVTLRRTLAAQRRAATIVAATYRGGSARARVRAWKLTAEKEQAAREAARCRACHGA